MATQSVRGVLLSATPSCFESEVAPERAAVPSGSAAVGDWEWAGSLPYTVKRKAVYRVYRMCMLYEYVYIPVSPKIDCEENEE